MRKTLKYLFLAVISLSALIFTLNISKADEENPYQKIRQGTFVKVLPREEISTLTADEEDEVTFINTTDMYVYETNAIPEGTIFFGEIEEIREPVQGRDGAIKISVHKMITSDKKVYKIKGHIYSENDNYIGGKQTESLYYHKVPHYTVGYKPFLKAVPLNIYEEGRHTVIKPGEEMFLIIEEDIKLK